MMHIIIVWLPLILPALAAISLGMVVWRMGR